jgi:hypothetical protein
MVDMTLVAADATSPAQAQLYTAVPAVPDVLKGKGVLYKAESPGHGVKLLGRLPCVQKVQVSIPARRMVPFLGQWHCHCPSC